LWAALARTGIVSFGVFSPVVSMTTLVVVVPTSPPAKPTS
jgi:hypothetical protein